MKKIIPLLALLSACSEPLADPPSVTNIAFKKAKDFPQINETIYGSWMETEEIYENKISKRRWFYISASEFGIGQWCFKGKYQNFSSASVPAQALDQTLIVIDDLKAPGELPDLPCTVNFPKGHYGLNYNRDEDQLYIIFPQTGEILRAVRYSSPTGSEGVR